MPYYTKQEVEKAREVDVLTYLQHNDPSKLVYIGSNTYCTVEHDSLKINNGKWYWFSQSIGGVSAIDYLIKVEGFSFLQAVEKVLKLAPRMNYNFQKTYMVKEKKTRLLLPEKNTNNNRVIKYLKSRCIDEDIILECIMKGLIYESAKNHNAVFVGFNEKGNPKYAGIRGTTKAKFMMDATGSDKTYSFRLVTDCETNTIHLFESAIDLLSYATYMQRNNHKWYNDTLIALAGVYQTKTSIKDSKIPKALEHYLENNSNIKNIYIHFDNDSAGRNATKTLKTILENNYTIIDNPPPYGKDYNDFLCYETGKIINKSKERGR